MPRQSFKLKNHVVPKAKRISGLLKGKYGIDLSILDKAIKGDESALQLIGEAGRQGAITQELMPALIQAYLSAIKGTEVYNKGVADIIKQGASSAISIDKSVSGTILSNTKYENKHKELKQDYVAAKQSENTRHMYAVNYIRLKSYIDQHLATVDGDAKLVDQANRPELKQFDENVRYQSLVAKHLLANGDNSQTQLLPRREYAVLNEGENAPRSIQEKVKSLGACCNWFSSWLLSKEKPIKIVETNLYGQNY